MICKESLLQIIPAENLVAAFQGEGCTGQLLAVAESSEAGRVMLEALEVGTHGVVLRTQDAMEVSRGRMAGWWHSRGWCLLGWVCSRLT